MPHIACPYQKSDGRPKDFVFSQWEFGLKHIGFQHRSETGRLITFAEGGHFQGRFTIPIQDGRRAEDDSMVSQRVVQAWLDALNDGFHTSDLPLDEPSFPQASDWTPQVGTPTLDGAYCKVRLTASEAKDDLAIHQLVKFGNPARVYRIARLQTIATTPNHIQDWYLLPSVLPLGTVGAPQAAHSIKFRMTNHVAQVRSQSTRGPWRVEWEEVVA